MSRKKNSNRTSKMLPVRKNVYISCEGDAEENYIKGLKKKYKKLATFKVINSPKTAAKDVVLRLRNEFSSEYDKNDLKFCIFDCDENSQENINDALRFARRENAQVVFSNPCFEIWLLWHFSNEFKFQSSREGLKNRMEELICLKYWKKEDLYEILLEKNERAKKNCAKRRKELNSDEEFLIKNNPYTNFDNFLLQLEKILLVS